MAGQVATRTVRRQRREDVRAQLVRAMVEQAEGSSFRDLRVDEIARRAGLSRSAFYFYFRDKHDVLMTAAGEVGEELYREADRWWHGEGDPETLVRQAITGVASLYARHGRLLGMAVEVSTYDHELGSFWRGLVGRFVDATAEHLEREVAAGRAHPLEPRGTAEALVWMAERCLWVYLSSGERSVEQVTEQLVPVWMAAIYRAAPPRAEPAG